MSKIYQIQQQIRMNRQGGSFSSSNRPIESEKKKVTIIKPPPQKKKKKMQIVEDEAVDTLERIHASNPAKKEKMEVDDEEKKTEKKEKPHKAPWGPSEILEHLEDPEVVCNVDKIIDSFQIHDKRNKYRENVDGGVADNDNIVWDHGASEQGKKSDSNFFYWLQSYCNHQSKRYEEQDNLIFE